MITYKTQNWPQTITNEDSTHRETIGNGYTYVEGYNPRLYSASDLCWVFRTAQDITNTEILNKHSCPL